MRVLKFRSQESSSLSRDGMYELPMGYASFARAGAPGCTATSTVPAYGCEFPGRFRDCRAAALRADRTTLTGGRAACRMRGQGWTGARERAGTVPRAAQLPRLG